jgi:hypothetical protein
VRLDGRVGGALEDVVALDHHVGRGQRTLHVAEAQVDLLVDVALLGGLGVVVVDGQIRPRQRLLGLDQRVEDLIGRP